MGNIKWFTVRVSLVVLVLLSGLSACQGAPTESPPTATLVPPATLPPPTAEPAAPALTATPEPPAAVPAPTEGAASAAVLVDNNDAGFALESGEWGHCFDGDCGGTCWGQDFVYAEPSCTACRARFAFQVPAAGDYDLWAWWPWGEDRATDTPYTLEYGGGTLVVTVDQRNSGDAWFWLAALRYDAGEEGAVVVGASRSGYANADAVALTPAGSGPPGGESSPGATLTPAAPPAPTPLAAVTPAPTSYRRVIFLHHSCGANLIAQGGVRERFAALGFEFYDHGYNGDGLVLADGTWTGQNWDVPDDNTNPDGYAAIFAQPLHSPPDNTFSHLMEFDVIVFKSCFPVSNIGSDEQLAEYKDYYRSIGARMDQYPDKVFVIVTQPPQVPANTDPQEAARAHAFAQWLSSPEFLGGRANVFTFDFFGLLADPTTNTLRGEYTSDPYDAHPNERANQAIAPLFVDFVAGAVRSHSGR